MRNEPEKFFGRSRGLVLAQQYVQKSKEQFVLLDRHEDIAE